VRGFRKFSNAFFIDDLLRSRELNSFTIYRFTIYDLVNIQHLEYNIQNPIINIQYPASGTGKVTLVLKGAEIFYPIPKGGSKNVSCGERIFSIQNGIRFMLWHGMFTLQGRGGSDCFTHSLNDCRLQYPISNIQNPVLEILPRP